MRTEDDLRAALLSLESRAPEVDAVLAPEVRPQVTRRTLLLAGTAAAAVVAVPVTVRLVADRETPTGQRPLHPLEFDFTVQPYDGHMPGSFDRSPGRGQRIGLWRDGVPRATVTVYERGQLDAGLVPTADPLTVGGRRGYYVSQPITGLPSGDVAWGVFWEYAPDAWASAWDLADDTRAWSLRAAQATRFDRAAPMRVPYRLDVPVPNTRPNSGRLARTSGQAHAGWHSRVVLETPEEVFVQLDAVSTRDYEESQEKGEPPVTAPVGEPQKLGDLVRVRFPTFVLLIGSAGLPDDVLLRTAGSVTPASDFADQGTWFDPREVFPI